ncbi:copper chaperone PCu(A)C [Phenylobacterium terrae]|uniref:Copper chaperone PCu(A)C n=1 Tax=Phenylobacterium terrae TaxID=2665495 RepID=A0ABW4N0C8_9CAUL
MRTLLAAAIAALTAAPALAHMPGGLEVVQAWSRPAAAGMTGAGYMTVRNHGKAAQTLVKVESPVAKKVEMHRTVTAGGVSRMQPVGQLVIPAGGEAKFAPGGQHLMLIGLTRPLKAGQHVPATLTFASGVKVKADIVVGTAAPPERAGSIHNH